jgi:hypothetical protein
MIKRAMCILMGILISVAAHTQEKMKFHSINMAGIAEGKSGGYGILQTVNGLGYKKWFAGIGAGIDYYKNKSIPLFFDVRTAVAKTDLYFFGDLGYNFSTHDIPDKTIYYGTYHFFGGPYTEIGIGYKILLARSSYLLLSSGYSYKELNNKITTPTECLVPPCTVDYSKYQYGYGRILFKAGFLF